MTARYDDRLEAQARHALDSARVGRRSTADSIEYCRRTDALYVPANMARGGDTAALHVDRCWLRNEWPESVARATGASAASLGDYDWRAALPRLEVPALIVHGADDAEPVAGSREWLRAPRARLCVLSGAGHWPFLERAADFDRVVDAFLGGRPSAAAAESCAAGA
jgi:pimeloyl-ACP methyl ester carboxylesterase